MGHPLRKEKKMTFEQWDALPLETEKKIPTRKARKTLAEWNCEMGDPFDAKHTETIVAKLFVAMDEAWKRRALKKANKVGDQIRKSDASAAKRSVREQLERLGKPTRNTVRLNLELPI